MLRPRQEGWDVFRSATGSPSERMAASRRMAWSMEIQEGALNFADNGGPLSWLLLSHEAGGAIPPARCALIDAPSPVRSERKHEECGDPHGRREVRNRRVNRNDHIQLLDHSGRIGHVRKGLGQGQDSRCGWMRS